LRTTFFFTQKLLTSVFELRKNSGVTLFDCRSPIKSAYWNPTTGSVATSFHTLCTADLT